jgi:hypothetical protein
MAAFQQRHYHPPVQGEGHMEPMADVAILASGAVEEEADTKKDDHTMTEDPVEEFHLANGGVVKHHQSVSLGMVEEEAVLVPGGPMVAGMGVDGEGGDMFLISTLRLHGQSKRKSRGCYSAISVSDVRRLFITGAGDKNAIDKPSQQRAG